MQSFKNLLAISCFLIAGITACKGQVSKYRPVKTLYGTVQAHEYMPGTIPIAYYTDFNIVFKNDSVAAVKGRLIVTDTIDHLSLSKKDPTLKISPRETKRLSVTMFDGRIQYGNAADSCWLFPLSMSNKKFTAYSNVPNAHLDLAIAIRPANSDILPITRETILPLATGNKRAMKWIEKGKLLMALDAIDKANREYPKMDQ